MPLRVYNDFVIQAQILRSSAKGVHELKNKVKYLYLCLLLVLIALAGCKVLNKEKSAAKEAEDGMLEQHGRLRSDVCA